MQHTYTLLQALNQNILIWGIVEDDSYRWTTVDAFSNKEELLSMHYNGRVPVPKNKL